MGFNSGFKGLKVKRDFRLSSRSRRKLHTSGLLRSEWLFIGYLTPEDGANKLYRSVGKELPVHAA